MALVTVASFTVATNATYTFTHGLCIGSAGGTLSMTAQDICMNFNISAAITEAIGISYGNSVACYLFGGAVWKSVTVVARAWHSVIG